MKKRPREFRIGVISDTHNYFDPKIPELFQGVDHILHGGDIGLHSIIIELERIAPVTAVFGNTDYETQFKEIAVVELSGHHFFLQHIVDPRFPDETLRARLQKFAPEVIVFGHTHKPFCERVDGRLFLNPGYAGKQRFNLERSVAILTCTPEGEMKTKYFAL